MYLILADKNRKEIRTLKEVNSDIDIGDTNDFELTSSIDDWIGDMEIGCYVYTPDTEFGGIIGEKESSTAENQIYVRGDTWRGMLAKKVIEPSSGQDYKTVSGELNSIIFDLISEAGLDDLFSTSEEDTGISVTNFSFDRYCTLLAGIEKMLASKMYRLEIKYINKNENPYVRLKAVPAVDFSNLCEISQDNNLDFTAKEYKRGINHLICLGKGDLKDRVVIHLYVQKDGSIGRTKYYTGINERTEIYDYGSAEEEDLINSGTEKLIELMDNKSFDAKIKEDVEFDMWIGDTISGRDYITGISVKKPIIGKILTIQDGEEKVEYRIEGDE